MTQPSLWDAPVVRPAAQVDQLRDRAIERVAQAAEDRAPGFLDRARAFVVAYLESYGPTSGEVLTLQCRQAGIIPHDDRAFGPVYSVLARRGVIEKVGTIRRERGHGTAGGNVWAIRRTL